MPMSKLRLCGSFAALAAAGCADRYEMVTAAVTLSAPDSVTDSTGSSDASGSEGGQPTEGPVMTTTETSPSDPSGNPSSDPTAPTTGEPVACETPESCTGMGSGDFSAFPLPFFRGRVCLSDAVRPDDKVAVWISSCVHPCFDVPGFKFKTPFRCDDNSCDLALAFYHPDTVGAACPSDAFGEFPAAGCEFAGPFTINVGPFDQGRPAGTLSLPFLTNDDVAAIFGGDDTGDAIWAKIESHAQAEGRTFPVTFSADNAAPPEACGEDVAGCTCHDIGL